MARINKIIMYMIIMSSFLSCKKYLDVKPDSKVTIPGSIADLQALLDRSDYMNQKNPGFSDASADDYFLTQANYSRVGIRGQSAYTWEPYANDWTNDWGNAYYTVYISNVCLETLNEVERTALNAAAWDNVKGTALFYRAYSFLNLTWTYAKAYDEQTAASDYGIILRLGSDFNVPSVRANVLDSYQRILTDLEAAIPLLPNTPQHVLRPSKAAVYALLARTCLSMRQYDKAYRYADLCLKIKGELIDYNTVSLISASPFQNFNQEVIFHTDISTYFYPNISPNEALVDTVLYNSYHEKDLRKLIYFVSSDKYQQFKGTYASKSPIVSPLFTGIATDEVYLIRAECLARAGDKDGALRDLNTLMKKRWSNSVVYVDFTAANNQEALTLILSERRKELLFRGLRWTDIKRLNKEGYHIDLKRIINGKEYTLKANSNKFALPLPNDITTISGVPQNPL